MAKITQPVIVIGGEETGEPVSLLKFFFNGCFYTFSVPFRVTWNENLKRYNLVYYKLHTVLCGLFHMLYISYTLINAYHLLYLPFLLVHPSDSSFVNVVFSTTCSANLQIFYYLLIKSVWLDRAAVENMINAVTIRSLRPKTVTKVNKALKIIGIAGFAVVLRFNCLNAEFTLNNNEERFANVTALGIPTSSWLRFSYIWFVTEVLTTSFSFTSHLFIVVLSCGLAAMAWEFRRELEKIGGDAQKGIELYRMLKYNISLVNNAWSGKLLIFSITLISYYGTLPDILMSYVYDEPWISVVVYTLVNTVGWVVAANFHASVQASFLKWSESCIFGSVVDSKITDSDNQYKLVQIATAFDNQMKLSVLRNEIHTEPIALSCDYFSVTNSFLCSVLSLILTYSIIIFQTRTQQ